MKITLIKTEDFSHFATFGEALANSDKEIEVELSEAQAKVIADWFCRKVYGVRIAKEETP